MHKHQKLHTFLKWIDKCIDSNNIKNHIKDLYRNILSALRQGSIKNIFKFSSIAKLLFLYCTVVLYIIIFIFDFSSGIFSDKSPHRIAVYSVKDRIGEHRSYVRTLKALDKMGWSYIGNSFDEYMINDKLISPFYKSAATILNIIFKPEFNLSLTHYVTIMPYGYNITYLNMPDQNLYSLEHEFKPEFGHLAKYDAYIDLASVVNGENHLLQSVLKNHNRSDAIIIPAYLAQNFEELMIAKEYNNAVITGSLWGCSRSSYRFRDAIHKLSDEKLLTAYGLPGSFDYLGDGYLGRLEHYGDPDIQIMDLQRKGGIALIVHNLEHLIQGLPTSRFAEGIISGSIIISDRHPFLQKYFGDNILYFDALASTEVIYNQIKSHIEWIKSHPDEARKMSQNAYDILVKDWTLEVQLQRIMKIVESR